MRYIPEKDVLGCNVCPHCNKGGYIEDDTCDLLNDWLKIERNPNVAQNEWIDPRCPLPIRDTNNRGIY
jgi:hypothetical protein